MLYDLVQSRKGRETVFMTDELPKVRDRMMELRQSQRRGIRNQRVIYSIRPSTETTEKFKKAPHRIDLSGDRQTPVRIRKK